MSAMEQIMNELRDGRFAMHKISETLTDLQSQYFKIISTVEEWRALQSSIATVHDSLEKRAKEVEVAKMETDMGMTRLENATKEVELRQKKLDMEENEMRKSAEGLELREKEVREWFEFLQLEKREVLKRLRAVAAREKCFADAYEQARVVADVVKEQSKEVKVKEEELVVREREVKRQREEGVVDDEFEDFARFIEIELGETTVGEREEALDVREKELSLKEGELNVLEQKEVKLEEYRKKLVLKENEMDELYYALELKERDNNQTSEMLMSKEKMLRLREEEVEEHRKGLELKGKKFEEPCEVLDAKEKRILEGEKAMELEQKQMDERSKLMEFKEKEIEERYLAMQAKEQQIHMQVKDLKGVKSKEKELNEQMEESTEEQSGGQHCIPTHCQALEVSEKQRGSSSLTLASQEPPDSDVHQVAPIQPASMISVGVIQTWCRFMDAEALRLYLIEHVNDNRLDEYVYDALRYAPYPGKLVLEVSRNFYQEFSDKGQSIDNKNSCILLLEQFTKLSPSITLEVQAAANDFAAVDWLPMLKAPGNTPADTFGYLQFLAAFKLASGYDPNKLVCLLNRLYGHGRLEVYRHEQQPSLCRALGVLDMIPDVIKSLIERNRKLTAVKYICVFKQERRFPPVPLLEAYLEQKRNEGISKPKNENSELSILQDVTNCIATFKLESEFLPDSNYRPEFLLSRIKELEREKEERRPDAIKRWKRRSLSSCDDVPSPKQLPKRPRLGC